MTSEELDAIRDGHCNEMDIERLVSEVRRLRDTIRAANIRHEVVGGSDEGDRDFCMWCGSENRGDRTHAYDCRAFNPDGTLK